MTIKRRGWMIAAGAFLLGLVIAHGIDRARAYDIPTTNALTYTGELYTLGAPDNGSHQMSINLYANGSSTPACGSASASTVTCVNGQFSIALPAACVLIVHQNPSVTVELTVDNTPLGAVPLTAVPYSVEADTASNAAPGSTLSTELNPPGTVIAYPAPVTSSVPPPTGWLLCNGQAVSRATYAALFQVMGTSAGSGDGATTFNLPDYRGRFLRGQNQGSGNDPDVTSRTVLNAGGNTGDAVSSLQGSQYASHTHSISDPGHSHPNSYLELGGGGEQAGGGSGATPCCFGFAGIGSATTGITGTNASGGTETRPVNVAVNYLIKY